MPTSLLTLAWLLGCTDPGTTAADSGAPVDSGTHPTASCGELPPRPALATDAWRPTETQPVAGGLFNLIPDPAAGVVYAASHNAGLFRSDDQGLSWTWLPVLITHTMSDLVVPAGRTGELLRSSGGRLEQSFDSGSSWRQLDLGAPDPDAPSQMVIALAGAAHDGERVFALTSDGSVWRSVDDAASFEVVGSVDIWVPPEDMNHLRYLGWRLLGEAAEGGPLLLATDQGLWRSVDGGETWILAMDGAFFGATLVRNPVDPDHLVVAGADAALHLSFDGGGSWESQTVGEDLGTTAFSADGSALWLASETSLLTSADGGRSQTRQDADFQTPGALLETDDGRLLLAHDNGISHTADGGSSWSETDEGVVDLGMSVLTPHPVCPNRLMLASRCSGGLFQSQDWGQSWDHVPGHFHYVMGVHHDPADPEHAWAVSDDALLESHDGGESWEVVWTRYHFHGFAIHPDDPETLLIGSVGEGEFADDDGWVYRSEDGGETWKDSGGGLPDNSASMHALQYWPGDPEVVLLATYKGGGVSHNGGEGIGLWRSTDGGSYWWKTDLDVADVAWLTPSPRGVVAATEDGLWESTDKGVSWVQLSGPEGFLLSVDFAGDTGVAVSREGMTWTTRDGGASWVALDTDVFWDPMGWLATVAVAADESVAWLTIFATGVYQIALD